MLNAWGISADYYRTWSKRGYSDEDILLKRVDSNWETLKSRTDHKGIVYKSVDDMCNAYNVTKSTYLFICLINLLLFIYLFIEHY